MEGRTMKATQNTRATIECPCCGHDLELNIYPGHKGTTGHRGPDPDESAFVEEFIGCDCHEYLDNGRLPDDALDWYEEECLDAARYRP